MSEFEYEYPTEGGGEEPEPPKTKVSLRFEPFGDWGVVLVAEREDLGPQNILYLNKDGDVLFYPLQAQRVGLTPYGKSGGHTKELP